MKFSENDSIRLKQIIYIKAIVELSKKIENTLCQNRSPVSGSVVDFDYLKEMVKSIEELDEK